MVRNVNRINNSGRAITHQVEVNVYYKGHIERMRIDICDLGKTEVILGILWLQAYNPKINWKTREVKMIRYLPLYSRMILKKKERKSKKGKRVVTLKEKRIVRWAINDKED